MKQTYWKFVGLCTGAMLLLSCTACGSKTEKGTVRIVEDKSAVTSSPALQEVDSQEVNFQTAEVGKEVAPHWTRCTSPTTRSPRTNRNWDWSSSS